MQTDVLIVGQGICGTLLSWWLHKEGKSVVVIDDGAENSSSKVAAGIMNPITGRRYVRTWMAEELLDFAKTTYTGLSAYLQAVFLYQRNIIDFFPSAQMRNAFTESMGENESYLRAYPDQNRFNDFFRYDFGCGEIGPAYTVNIQHLLLLWRQKLNEMKALREEKFASDELTLTGDGVAYANINAQKIIFCDGIAAMENRWFSALPFAAIKGEAVLIECNDLPADHLFKRGLMLAPMQQKGLFWVGSSYQWEFENDEPSEQFFTATTAALNHWLKKPYKVLHHKAAVRPATVERRPFVGFHPVHQQVGILNGMGTKGTSLAPFFAHQLAQHLVHNFPIAPQAHVRRFSRILTHHAG